jgi:hypothetical protein
LIIVAKIIWKHLSPQQRKSDMDIATESEVQNKIKIRLLQGPAYQTPLADRCYLTDRTDVTSEAYLFQPLPNGGNGPRLLVPNLEPMEVCSGIRVEAPTLVDFTQSPATRGVYTIGATGGCVPVALIFGGNNGGPIEAIHMHHLYGDQQCKAQYWAALKGTRTDTPSAVVVYLYDAIGGDRRRMMTEQVQLLNFPTNIITFYHDGLGRLAVDKWGRFGSIEGNVKAQ